MLIHRGVCRRCRLPIGARREVRTCAIGINAPRFQLKGAPRGHRRLDRRDGDGIEFGCGHRQSRACGDGSRSYRDRSRTWSYSRRNISDDGRDSWITGVPRSRNWRGSGTVGRRCNCRESHRHADRRDRRGLLNADSKTRAGPTVTTCRFGNANPLCTDGNCKPRWGDKQIRSVRYRPGDDRGEVRGGSVGVVAGRRKLRRKNPPRPSA
jgi:hypothetical protein